MPRSIFSADMDSDGDIDVLAAFADTDRIVLYENDGSVRLNVIASRLGLHPKHVSTIIEQFLIRDGLVTKNNSIRILTQDGLNHLRKYHLGEV